MFLVKISISLFYIRLDIDNKQCYITKKDLNMKLRELNCPNAEFDFKNVVVRNTKGVISI